MPASKSPLQNNWTRFLLLPASILVATGGWSALRAAREVLEWSPRRLASALSATETERLESHVSQTIEGGFELVLELQRWLPDDAVLFGFYPSEEEILADPALAPKRTEALTFLGELQLLLYPTNVQIMPAQIALPSGAPKNLIFALDMSSPKRELLDVSLEPLFELPSATLLGVRGEVHRSPKEPSR
jgi:hypothetical protein